MDILPHKNIDQQKLNYSNGYFSIPGVVQILVWIWFYLIFMFERIIWSVIYCTVLSCDMLNKFDGI